MIKGQEEDMDTIPLAGLCRSVAATAASMGLRVKDDMKAEDRALARAERAHAKDDDSAADTTADDSSSSANSKHKQKQQRS